MSFGAVEVLRRALDDVADLDVDMLVAVGPEGDPPLLGEVATNVQLERFVDQAAVLPLVDLMVHHGGTGTVLGALAAGRPQLILPQGADQFFNGDVLVRGGAGAAAQRGTGTRRHRGSGHRAARSAVPERAVARQIQAEIAALPTPAEVVPELVAWAGVR